MQWLAATLFPANVWAPLYINVKNDGLWFMKSINITIDQALGWWLFHQATG